LSTEITLDLPTSTDPATPTTPADTERQAADTKTDITSKDTLNAAKVDLRVWAKTSAENRELKAKHSELQAKVDELTKANPDAEKALQTKLLELLKAPGTAKRLVTDGGRTFDDIVAELTDIPLEDPVTKATNERLAKLEAERQADKDAEVKRKEADTKAQQEKYHAESIAEIEKFAKSNAETIQDDKDPRNGTERWVVVASRPDLIQTAESEVSAWINTNRPKGVSQEEAKTLVEQALDQLELIERQKLSPLLTKLIPAQRTNSRGNASNESRFRVTETPSQANKPRPSTITEALKGPMPTKKPGHRYSGGPREIRFDDSIG